MAATKYPKTLDIKKLIVKYYVALREDGRHYVRRDSMVALPRDEYLREGDVIKGYFIDPKKGLRLDKDPVDNDVEGGSQWLYCSVVDLD